MKIEINASLLYPLWGIPYWLFRLICPLSKWAIDPEQDIWSLGVMVQGSSQMGELLGRRRHLEIQV